MKYRTPQGWGINTLSKLNSCCRCQMNRKAADFRFLGLTTTQKTEGEFLGCQCRDQTSAWQQQRVADGKRVISPRALEGSFPLPLLSFYVFKASHFSVVITKEIFSSLIKTERRVWALEEDKAAGGSSVMSGCGLALTHSCSPHSLFLWTRLISRPRAPEEGRLPLVKECSGEGV